MNSIYKSIYNEIKKYKKIYIARHIGADPDAFGSQMALKHSIKLTFPEKEVYAVGATVSRFKYFGKVDKVDNFDYENALLIVTDTPDKKRVDIDNFLSFKHVLKIDHHPFVDSFNGVEYIKRESVKEMESELKQMKEIMKEINKLSLFTNVSTDTTTRHTQRVNGNDSNIYQVPPSGQELWEIRLMNNDGEFFSKVNNRKLKVTIKEVFITQKELSRNTTVKEARELRKKLNLNEYTFNRLVYNIQQGVFSKFIKQWNKMTQPVVGEKQIPFENNPQKRKENGVYAQ